MDSIRTDGLLKFIEDAEDAGHMKFNSARGKRALVRIFMEAGCTEVSGTYGSMVLDTIHKERKFSDQTLKTYQSRLSGLVKGYKKYLKNGFTFPVVQVVSTQPVAKGSRRITTQMVIRGEVVTLSGFPVDLTRKEKDRMSAYLEMYVADEF
jgi:hypothetical protein